MLEKELNELSDETILTLYKSIVPSTSIIESVNKKLEKQSSDGVEREHSVSRLQRAPGIGAYGNHVSGHTVSSQPFPSCLDSNVSYPLRLQCSAFAHCSNS